MTKEIQLRGGGDLEPELPTTLRSLLDRAADVPIAELAAAAAGACVGAGVVLASTGNPWVSALLAPVTGFLFWFVAKARVSAERTVRVRAERQLRDEHQAREREALDRLEEEIATVRIPAAQRAWEAELQQKYDYVVAQLFSGEWDQATGTVTVSIRLATLLPGERKLSAANPEPGSPMRVEVKCGAIAGGGVTLVQKDGLTEIVSGGRGGWKTWEFVGDHAPALNLAAGTPMMLVDVRLLAASTGRAVECRGSIVVR